MVQICHMVTQSCKNSPGKRGPAPLIIAHILIENGTEVQHTPRHPGHMRKDCWTYHITARPVPDISAFTVSVIEVGIKMGVSSHSLQQPPAASSRLSLSLVSIHLSSLAVLHLSSYHLQWLKHGKCYLSHSLCQLPGLF